MYICIYSAMLAYILKHPPVETEKIQFLSLVAVVRPKL